MAERITEQDSIGSTCAGCGKPLDSDLPSWCGTVNLTADTLVLGHAVLLFDEAVSEFDVAYDWCDPACFGRWLHRMADGARARP